MLFAAIKIAASMAGLAVFTRPAGETVADGLSVGVLLVLLAGFVASATYLTVAGSADRRAHDLAAAFVLVAAAFSNPLLARGFALAPESLREGALLLGLVPADAFLPFFMWSFALGFPRAPLLGVGAQIARRMSRVSLYVGATLFIANVAFAFDRTAQTTSTLR